MCNSPASSLELPERKALGEAPHQGAGALREALLNLIDVIEAAGVSNLSRGVVLGPVVWSVKCNDALSLGRAALAQHQALQQGEPK